MITIYDWFGYSLPIYERYHLIKQAGFDGVLLWWSDGFGRGDYPDGPKLAQKAGLFIENIHAPIQNQDDLWLDNLKGEALTNCCLQCIKDCSDFRIPTMVVHLHDNGGSRSQHQLPFDGKINWNVVMQKLAQIQYKGAIALEPMNWDYSELTVEQFLYTAFRKAKKPEALKQP